ncbi:transposase [Micromonospora sp. WMMA1949]|uniref:transposase n=1 Tax=unclassified Micromonospora TaxID=2617518 RepID=UPI0022B72E27|nr:MULTISPECIES: transposase [unclassified Micromonospora]MCZ7430034.1 transposase [Micromonospora sp. WMMA1949]
MPKPYPREFRDDVVRVARDREAGVTVEQTAKDCGVHPMTLFTWLRQADVDAGAGPVTEQGQRGCQHQRHAALPRERAIPAVTLSTGLMVRPCFSACRTPCR